MRRVGELDAAGGIAGMNGTAIAEKLGKLIAEELSACGIEEALQQMPATATVTRPIGVRPWRKGPSQRKCLLHL